MSTVVAQRGDDDFIVESTGSSYLVQAGVVSKVENVDSLLARGYWGDPTISEEEKQKVIALIPVKKTGFSSMFQD